MKGIIRGPALEYPPDMGPVIELAMDVQLGLVKGEPFEGDVHCKSNNLYNANHGIFLINSAQ